MSKGMRIAIVVLLVIAVAAVIGLKGKSKPGDGPGIANSGKGLPRLVDLGATECIPCKMMAPILEELGKEKKGKLEVVFIDVWKNPSAKKEYGIDLIPTQIFYDSSGKEFFRHLGFFSREDILAKFAEQGIKL